MKIVINHCIGGYSLSEDAYIFLGLEWDEYGFNFHDDRSNEELIKCVEALGNNASGRGANLKVVEIPNNIEWYIDTTDMGYESIHEEHRVWEYNEDGE